MESGQHRITQQQQQQQQQQRGGTGDGGVSFEHEWDAVNYLKNPPRSKKSQDESKEHHAHHRHHHRHHRHHQIPRRAETKSSLNEEAKQSTAATSSAETNATASAAPPNRLQAPAAAAAPAPSPSRRQSTVKLTQAILDQAKAMQDNSWPATPSSTSSSRSRKEQRALGLGNQVIAQRFFDDTDDDDNDIDGEEEGGIGRAANNTTLDEDMDSGERSEWLKPPNKTVNIPATGARHDETSHRSQKDRGRVKWGESSPTRHTNEVPDHRHRNTGERGKNSISFSHKKKKKHKEKKSSHHHQHHPAEGERDVEKTGSSARDPDALDPDATGVHLKTLTVPQLCFWLAKNNLQCYRDTIEEGVVTGEMLAYVSKKELKWLGVGTAAEQARLLKIVKHARRKGVEIHLNHASTTLPALPAL